MQTELKEIKNWDCHDKMPTIMDYQKLLNIASRKFNLSINKCRDKFGQYTYSQWKKLLTKTTMQTINTAPEIQSQLDINLKPHQIQNIIQVVNQFNNGEISLQDEIFDGAGVSVGQMFDDLKIEVKNNEQEEI